MAPLPVRSRCRQSCSRYPRTRHRRGHSRPGFQPAQARHPGVSGGLERGPERLSFRQRLWAAIESHCPPHALLLSSRSDITASLQARKMRMRMRRHGPGPCAAAWAKCPSPRSLKSRASWPTGSTRRCCGNGLRWSTTRGKALPDMIPARRGLIVNISGIAGIATTPFAGACCACQAALDVASNAPRVGLRPFGIEVTTVQPGGIRSVFDELAVSPTKARATRCPPRPLHARWWTGWPAPRDLRSSDRGKKALCGPLQVGAAHTLAGPPAWPAFPAGPTPTLRTDQRMERVRMSAPR